MKRVTLYHIVCVVALLASAFGSSALATPAPGTFDSPPVNARTDPYCSRSQPNPSCILRSLRRTSRRST